MLTILCSVEDSLVTSCEGATKYGPVVHVDFHKINRPCTCIVTPLFAGELLVISRGGVFPCYTQVYVQNIIFRCSSDLLHVSHSISVTKSILGRTSRIRITIHIRNVLSLYGISAKRYNC